MTYVSLALSAAGMATFVSALAARLKGIINHHTLMGWCIVGNAINLVSAALRHDSLDGGICAGGTALAAWVWWNGGGGDDTKRRLRRLARKFQGVRRTASAAT
ncbi:hypothetical protein [Streptomyces sp. NPDC020298]|uniref:hypothetical protein n=1 Tax=unclassified Streptomyces TaxID=2593676 RepID=UPI0033FB29FA